MSRQQRPRGLALILVVAVLSILLVLSMLYMQRSAQELRMAYTFRDDAAAQTGAEHGLNQAAALLQYDVWGVNEERAFVCQGGGRLRDASGALFAETPEALNAPDGSVPFFFQTKRG